MWPQPPYCRLKIVTLCRTFVATNPWTHMLVCKVWLVVCDCFSVAIKAGPYLDNNLHSESTVIPSERIASQHLTGSCPTTHDINESAFDTSNIHPSLFESFSLPSWKEIGLPGHESLPRSLNDANDLDGSPCDLDHLLSDTFGDDMVGGEYESCEDDSGEILERLQESEQLSREGEARSAIGTVTSTACLLRFT